MRLLFHSSLERVRGGVLLKLDFRGQGGEKVLDIDGKGVGGLEN